MTMTVYDQWLITSLEDRGEEEVKTISIYEMDKEDWQQPLIDYLEYEKLPTVLTHKTEVQRRASHFLYCKRNLHRCSFLSF